MPKPAQIKSALAPLDAAVIKSLAETVMVGFQGYSESIAKAAEAQAETARINAEWRVQERQHELDLARLDGDAEVRQAEVDAASSDRNVNAQGRWLHEREWTIRVISVLLAAGLMVLLGVGIATKAITIVDPGAFMSQLAMLGAFVFLLARQTKSSAMYIINGDDDGSEPD